MHTIVGMPDYAIVNLLELDDSTQARVQGMEPEGGDGVPSDSPWPDQS